MAIAICGMNPQRVLPDNIELWGMLHDPEWVEFDRLFDLHEPELHSSYLDMDRFKTPVPLVLRDNYPLQDVIGLVGDYFQCSISYMLGLAILEDRKDILITGVSGTEDYSIQRPNLEYLIGFARGRGAKVEIISESKLLTFTPIEGYTTRYGYGN